VSPCPSPEKKKYPKKNLNKKFERGKDAGEGGLMGPATDLAPEDLMAGAAEIQGALCWHQTEGRCWRWGQIRVMHVKTQENIETEEELAQLTHRRLATSPRTRTSASTAYCMFLFSSAQIECFFCF
jgi:hypothetical protein